MQLQLETIAYCNAACVFCPYPKMTRQRGIMAWPLFETIIDEAARIEPIDNITLTGLGEPLMDNRIVERVAYIRSRSKRVEISVYTNGSLLTVDMGERLRDAGLNQLYVSMNATSADKREQIMHLKDYERVAENVKALIPKAGDMAVIVKALLSKDLLEAEEHDAFRENWGDRTFMHMEGNWAGTMWPVRTLPKTACVRALNQIMVLWDGRVSLCCFDGEGEVIFGDLNKQTLRDVFAGPEATRYRMGHIEGKRGELALCKTCTAI